MTKYGIGAVLQPFMDELRTLEKVCDTFGMIDYFY